MPTSVTPDFFCSSNFTEKHFLSSFISTTCILVTVFKGDKMSHIWKTKELPFFFSNKVDFQASHGCPCLLFLCFVLLYPSLAWWLERCLFLIFSLPTYALDGPCVWVLAKITEEISFWEISRVYCTVFCMMPHQRSWSCCNAFNVRCELPDE